MRDQLHQPDLYPLTSKYDAGWLLALDMGPNPLWLMENLLRDLRLEPGMRVLDLGSGRGATSVFLAREFDVDVVAVDLWVDPATATAVFEDAGVADRVEAVRAEAHSLPFDRASFDAIISIDAYEYFGTADGYLAYITRFLKPGGQLGVATPAMRREVREIGHIPHHIRTCVGWEAMAWHTADWWRFQWAITELVTVTSARFQERGWADWLRWERAKNAPTEDGVIAMLEADGGELLTFAFITAVK
ncbi:cyclopropane-fatty-acyl-phospholipid synthase family protein [Phenylobacterium sp.]|uniref:SAM-dependent methyltransferase n=1 Tax=Phenylobacterium sp. TaxID=1871053 RepID=UPI00272FF6D2|nr:methyltransferase domain-containing protein [Phenylobacterium sp.]MDP1617392.1 methyltransferase domain-containing protein [Phenylobacterium sp.]MDP1985914.1 methyltransferase domain-containing protein [Phenylobacterium sp.]